MLIFPTALPPAILGRGHTRRCRTTRLGRVTRFLSGPRAPVLLDGGTTGRAVYPSFLEFSNKVVVSVEGSARFPFTPASPWTSRNLIRAQSLVSPSSSGCL